MPSKIEDQRRSDSVTHIETSSKSRIETSIDIDRFSCPVPVSVQGYPQIILGHGGGGKLSAELIESVFMPAFGNNNRDEMRDSAVLSMAAGRYAFSTDTYVVRPLFFAGGSIGHLAVHGTINDLAMSGATPLYLSAGFVLEEGFPIAQLQRIAQDMGQAAALAGVRIVTGDTKVVERGHGDGCYINTAGIGIVRAGTELGIAQVTAGDVIVLSGTLGDHGMTIMSAREGLEFEASISSDTAALHEMVNCMLDACASIRMLRDPTRGGLAASLNEICAATNLGIEIDETVLPMNPVVQSACEILGLDPLTVANEGKLIAIVAASEAEALVRTMRTHRYGEHATIIGRVVSEHPQMVVSRTSLGASRVIPMPLGEQLPRIC